MRGEGGTPNSRPSAQPRECDRGEAARRPRSGPRREPRASPGARASLGVADVFPSRPSAGSGGSRSLRIASTVPVPRKRPPSPSPGLTALFQKKRCGLMAS